MIQEQLTVLAELAKCDGTFDDSEKALIRNIGVEKGLSEEEVDAIIKNANGYENLSTLSDEERFDLLYNSVLMMKVDGKILNEEVQFCERIALALGYELQAVMEIYGDVHANVKISGLKENLRRKVEGMQETKIPGHH